MSAPKNFGPTWSCTIRSINPDGTIADERVTYNRLNTDNWGKFLQALFTTTVQAGNTLIPSLTDSANTARAGIYMYSDTAVASYFGYTANMTAGVGPYFQLGTGATAAARSDHVLQTPIAGTQTLNASYVTGSGIVSFGGSITYAANQTPSECGLYMFWNIAAASAAFLLDHQVFTALSANLTFTVAYTITLS